MIERSAAIYRSIEEVEELWRGITNRSIFFSLSLKIFRYTCATSSELQSEISTMAYSLSLYKISFQALYAEHAIFHGPKKNRVEEPGFSEWLEPNLVWFQLKNPSNVNRHQFFVSKYIYQDYSWGRIYQIFFFKSNIIIKYLERRKKTDPDPVSRRCLMIVSLMRICTDPDPTLPSGGNTIFLNLKKVNPRFSQGLWTQYCFLKSEKFIYIIPKLLSL